MGASALKSKVFKLVFTIFLSFFAFTIFGLVDTVSCWNRADSVAKAMEIAGTKSVLFKKEHKKESFGYTYNQDSMISLEEYKKINEEYGNDFLIKGLVGRGAWSGAGELRYDSEKSTFTRDSSSSSSNTEQKYDATVDTDMSGFVYFKDNSELERAGFTIQGRLPLTRDEVAISKHHYDSLKYNNSEINSYDGLYVKLGDRPFDFDNDYNTALRSFKVVGVVDDGTDFSQYSNVTEEQFNSDDTIQGKIRADMNYTFASVVYISEELYNFCSNSTQDTYIYVTYKMDDNSTSSASFNDKEDMMSLEGAYLQYVQQVIFDQSNNRYEIEYNEDDSLKFLLSVNDWHNQNGDRYNDETKQWEHGYDWYARNNWDINYNFSTDEYEYSMKEDGTSTNEDISREVTVEQYPTRTQFIDACLTLHSSVTPESLIGTDGKMRDLTKNEIIIGESIVDYNHSASKINAFRTRENNNVDIECNNEIIGENLNVIALLKSAKRNDGSDWYEQVLKECSVIAYSNYYDEVIEPKLKGYWYVGVVLSNDSTVNTNFVKYCEVFNKEGNRYTILNSATSTLDFFEGMISTISTVFLYVAIAFAVFASLLLMNFISTSISYKKREIGVLRALGARGSDVFGIFFNESAIIAMINFVLATIATMIACSVINVVMVKNLGIQIVLLNGSIRQPLLILAISLASAFISSLLPVIKISKKKPIDAINNR